MIEANNIIDLCRDKLCVYYLFTILFICFNVQGLSQDKDSIGLIQDSLSISSDSIAFQSDTLPQRTSINENVKVSNDALDDPIDYSARDSIVYDLEAKKIYLYGAAKVSYTSLEMAADYIIFDWENNEVFAEYRLDSLNQKTGIPKFKDKDQDFSAEKMRYNFKTGKGIIYDVTSTYSDLYILGSKAKFLAGQQSDSTSIEDHVYSSDALFTSCDHPEPHYGIRSKKQKVIPNKLVIVGPSNLEIMGVPTPLFLPFGFFPIAEKRRAGLIFPSDYEYSPVWGFGLREIGYYTPIGEKLDLSLTGDIYFKGTYGLHLSSNYKNIYKYSGRLQLNWADRKSELRGIQGSDKSFSINWSHNQDPRAHPSRTFSASVNIQTNNYQSVNRNDAQSVLQNILSSNVSFRKSFPDKPFSLTANANHSQNTSTRQVKITLPNVDFVTQTLLPFKRKERTGPEQWYEKVSMSYKASLKNQFTATDTTLFSNQTLEDAQFGMNQTVSANTSFKLLKYFSFNPSVNYREVWYLKTLEKEFNFNPVIDSTFITNSDSTETILVVDTTSLGTVDDINRFGYQRWGDFNAGFSINTQIFGTHLSKKGFIRGLRHVIKPSLSFNYRPANDLEQSEKIKTLEYENIDGEIEEVTYSIFENGIFGAPSSSGTQANIGYSLNNIFEGKYFSKKDSTEQKFKFFDNLNFTGSYNLAADSLKFSTVGMNGTTRLFRGVSTLNLNARWDPYAVNDDGDRIDEFQFKKKGQLLRYLGGQARLSTNLSFKQIRELARGVNQSGGSVARSNDSNDEEEKPKNISDYGSITDLLEGFRLSHQFVLAWDIVDERDSISVSTHTINLQGNMNLTDQWSIRVGNIGYDIKNQRLTYPDLSFSRKLHCWEMGLSWQAQRGTYSFYLRVNPSSTLNFIKIPWDKRDIDAFQGF